MSTFEDTLFALEQAQRWLDTMRSLTDHGTPVHRWFRPFAGFCQTLSQSPTLRTEFSALLDQAAAAGTALEINGVFSKLRETSHGIPAAKGDEFSKRIFPPIAQTDASLESLRLFSEVLFRKRDAIFSEAPSMMNRATEAKKAISLQLSRSHNFERPYFEALLLHIADGFFHWNLADKAYSFDVNHRPILPSDLLEAMDSIHNYLRFRARTTRSIPAAAARFRVWAEWFGRTALQELLDEITDSHYKQLLDWEKDKANKKRPRYLVEKPLHNELNRFFFEQGFMPVVNFRLANDEPDTLLLPPLAAYREGGRPVVIEVKQTIRLLRDGTTLGSREVPTAQFLHDAINQLVTYMDYLETSHSVETNDGIVVCFYNSKDRVAGVTPSVLRRGDKEITVLLVYLGDGDASSALSPIDLQNLKSDGDAQKTG